MLLNLEPQFVQGLINYLDTKPHNEVRLFIDVISNAAQQANQVPPGPPASHEIPKSESTK